jgi:DnaJ-domain-containing protein 1
VADNVTKQTALDAFTAQVAQLQADLAAAQAATSDPAELAAVVADTAALAALTQTLSDATTVNAPAN